MRNCKFTLVELLLVIVILLMLTAALLPALSKSRSQARRTNCLSNLNQLGIAARLYSDEQKYYPAARILGPGASKYYWCAYFDGSNTDMSKGLMSDYVKNFAVYRCSEFESMYPEMHSTSSYGINAEYIGGTPDAKPVPTEEDILNSLPAKVQEIKNPATTMIFMDSASAETGSMAESYYFWARYFFMAGTGEHKARSHFRHTKSANGIFCDGHAEDALMPEAIDNADLKIGWPEQKICERE